MNLPYKHHVLICTGPRCGGERGSGRIRQEFRKEFVRQAIPTSIRETECLCFGLCSHGPNVIIYPAGVVYSGVRTQDVAEIVRQHLVRGQPVERLLYRGPKKQDPPPDDSDDPLPPEAPPGPIR